MVHCILADSVKSRTPQCYAGRFVRSREAPLVEGQEVGFLQSE